MLEKLFIRHARKLHRHLLNKTSDPELSSDIVQDTFLRLAERGAHAGGEYKAAYLFKIANNLLIDHLRQLQSRKTDTSDLAVFAEVADEQAMPEAQALDRHELDRFRQILRMLPKRSREVFILCRLEGWTYKEVAEHLDISASAVQKDMSFALARVTDYMSGLTEPDKK